jgi:hypothetical protein
MIAESTEPELQLRYQGPGYATEIWGVTQANFIIAIPGRNARELAVNVGPPVTTYMAEKAGREDTPEFRDAAAGALGECRLRQLYARGHQIDAIETITADLLEREPELLDCALKKLQAL